MVALPVFVKLEDPLSSFTPSPTLHWLWKRVTCLAISIKCPSRAQKVWVLYFRGHVWSRFEIEKKTDKQILDFGPTTKIFYFQKLFFRVTSGFAGKTFFSKIAWTGKTAMAEKHLWICFRRKIKIHCDSKALSSFSREVQLVPIGVTRKHCS